MKTETDEFSERLTQVVDRSGLSRAEFARRIEVGDTTLKNYMLGKTQPSVKELRAIVEVGQVALPWLIFGGDVAASMSAQGPTTQYDAGGRHLYSREFIALVHEAMEEEIAAVGSQPSPKKRADLLSAFLYLFKPHDTIEREAIRMLIDHEDKRSAS